VLIFDTSNADKCSDNSPHRFRVTNTKAQRWTQSHRIVASGRLFCPQHWTLRKY